MRFPMLFPASNIIGQPEQMLTNTDLQGFADAQCTSSSVRSTCSTFRPRARMHYPGQLQLQFAAAEREAKTCQMGSQVLQAGAVHDSGSRASDHGIRKDDADPGNGTIRRTNRTALQLTTCGCATGPGLCHVCLEPPSLRRRLVCNEVTMGGEHAVRLHTRLREVCTGRLTQPGYAATLK